MGKSSSWKTSIWQVRAYVDLWSVNHFLCGCLFGGASIFLKLGFWKSFSVSTLLMILWEIFEHMLVMYEPLTNKIMDVVIGVAGFLAVWRLFPLINSFSRTVIFFALAGVFVFLEVWGFYVHLKKKE